MGADSSLKIPAKCVERGRWAHRTQHFAPAPRAAYSELRRVQRAGQAAVWADVAAKQKRLQAFSPTDAAESMYVSRSASLEEYVPELPNCSARRAASSLSRTRSSTAPLGRPVAELGAPARAEEWGYRELVEEYIDREASPDPAKIGVVLSTVGKKGFWGHLDAARSVPKGRSAEQLQDLYPRRNLIAHTGDRKGRGRASLSLSEVDAFADTAKSIVAGLEQVL